MRTWRAAVLVAVVVIGGACGSSDGSGGSGTDAKGRPKLPIGASGGGGAGITAEGSADNSRSSEAATSMIAPARFVEFRLADGAKAPTKEAAAYEVVPTDDKGVAADVAKALDVEANQVEVQQGLSWYYSRASKDGTVSSGVAVACNPDGECPEPVLPPPPPGVPSAAEAEDRFQVILGALDVDVAGGEFETLADLAPVRQVTFRPSVGGFEIEGFESSIAFGENGRIEYANGFLGRFEEVGTYPLIDLAAALERQQSGFGGGVRTMGAAEGPVADSADAQEGGGSSGSAGSADQVEPSDPGQTEPGSPGEPGDEPVMTIEPQPTEPTVPLEPEIVEITGADLVLQVVYGNCPEDEIYLVPAFRLLPLDRAGFSVVAVADDSLAGAGSDPEKPVEPCEGQTEPDVPVGKPEPAPLPADRGATEPARP